MKRANPATIAEYHLHRYDPAKLPFAIHDLSAYLEANREMATKPHIHSYYQIIWFQSGIGKHYVDFKSYDVFDNAIFFVAMNQVHYFDDNTQYKGILIHFNESFLGQQNSEIDFFLKCSLFNNPFQLPSCCIGKDTEPLLHQYIDLIRTELAANESFGREEMLRTYLKAFLIQVQRRKAEYEKSQGQEPFMADEKRIQLVRFINLIDSNYTKGLSVAAYAKRMHISSRTLSDLTHQLINKTPLQMIQERIIIEAQRLLLHSTLNINQIGYQLGFEDPSYFVKYFKKHTQTSPSDFRKTVS